MTWVAVAVGAGTVVSGAISSNQQRKAAEGATAAQVVSGDKAIAEQQRQFDAFQKVLAPYTEGGESGFGGMLDILGLSGPEKASEAVLDIEASPVFQSIAEQGEKGILARASATGGLRGGNVQGALAQFRPNLLNNFINQRFGQLGSVAQLGQASAAGTGAAGLQTGANIGNILQNQGAAQAHGLLARGQANAAPFNMLSQMGGFAFGKQF
jgi:hypothetical protein